MTKAKPAAPDRSAENRIAKRAAEKATDSMREKILVALLGFVLTGVIGTALTTWIQQRGWSWQNRVAKIDKDTENAITTYRSASELINARWHATYRMVRAIERSSEGEEWKAAKDAFDAADRDWALRYTNVAREIEFYIDTPFGVEGAGTLGKVWQLSCADFALNNSSQDAIGSQSARVVLEIINHCHGRMKDELDGMIDKRATAPVVEKKALTDLSFRRLDHLYKTNEALRCVIFGRALSIRRSIAAESYWETFFGIGQINYKLSEKASNCS
ncbi:MAG: hypothetical protein ACRCWF_12345 [Beijerinckiaceae bacterium]